MYCKQQNGSYGQRSNISTEHEDYLCFEVFQGLERLMESLLLIRAIQRKVQTIRHDNISTNAT